MTKKNKKPVENTGSSNEKLLLSDVGDGNFNTKTIEFNLENGVVNISRAMLDTGKIYYFKHKWHNSTEDWIDNIFSTQHSVTSMVDKFGKLNSEQLIELETFINFE